MKGIQAIVQKELSRVFKDRKLIFSLFILPVAIMIGVMYMASSFAMKKEDDIKQHIPTVYIQNEPTGFEEFVSSCQVAADIKVIDASADVEEIKQQIIDGEVELLYIFDEGFVEDVANYQNGASLPQVTEYYNPSEDYSSEAKSVFGNVLEQLRQSILVKRFGNDDAIAAFNVNSEIIVNQEKATGQMLGQFIPYFVSILIFAGAMGLVIDAIAGEKERGTLASMLLTPVKRSEIALGKLISLIILSCTSAAIYIIAMLAAAPVMFGDMPDLSLKLSGVQIVELVVLLLSMVFLYIALIATASIYAKDTKTASSYVAPMYLLVMVVGLASMFITKDNPAAFMYAIPFYGNALTIQNIMINNISIVNYLIDLGATVALASILVAAMTKAFNSEKIMFNA